MLEFQLEDKSILADGVSGDLEGCNSEDGCIG